MACNFINCALQIGASLFLDPLIFTSLLTILQSRSERSIVSRLHIIIGSGYIDKKQYMP